MVKVDQSNFGGSILRFWQVNKSYLEMSKVTWVGLIVEVVELSSENRNGIV